MESASKRMLKHQSSLPVLPAVVVSVLMVALLALGTVTDPAAAKAPTGGTLRGTTSQGLPGYVKTSYGGVLIDKSSIPIEVRCSFGPMFLPQTFKMVVISPGGRFKETAEGSDLDEGVSVRIFESFSGKFNRQRTRVVTKSRIYATIHSPDGSVEKSDSGVVTMHAHR
jgi:hypothetical protein